MPQNQEIYQTPVEVRARLQEIGVAEDVLTRALLAGLSAKTGTSRYAPTMSAGINFYSVTAATLRETLANAGWHSSDAGNVASISNPENGYTITVCAGDAQAGMSIGPDPMSLRAKGDVYRVVVELGDPDLFGEAEEVLIQVAAPDSKTFILLWYHDVLDGEHVLRAELSRPAEATEKGFIYSWHERIILHVPMGEGMPPAETDDDSGPDTLPDVQIRI